MSATRSAASTSRLPADGEVALRPSVHAVMVGEDLVLLDAAADAYLCVRGDRAAPLALSADRRRVAAAADLRSQLIAAGAAEPEGHAARPPERPTRSAPPPHRSAVRDTYAPPGLRDAPDAVRTLVSVARRYRGRSFADVIASGPDRRAPSTDEPLLKIVDRFHRWAPYAPTSAKCLLRSFMLRTVLQRAGHDPLWVFGVQTWPFRAHCWLQAGDLVLDDTPDRVAGYTPILVV